MTPGKLREDSGGLGETPAGSERTPAETVGEDLVEPGWVYSGPIGAIVSPMLTNMKQSKDLPYASTLCGACRDVCPVKIDIPRLLLHLRHKLAESPDTQERASTDSERLMARAYARLMSSPILLAIAHQLGRNLQKLLPAIPFITTIKGGKGIRKVPLPPLSNWTRSKDLPPLPPRTFREIWRRELSSKEKGDK